MERKQDARKGEQSEQSPRPEDKGRPDPVEHEAQAEKDERKPLDLRVRTLRAENDESGGH
jgi:hypothetical protein